MCFIFCIVLSSCADLYSAKLAYQNNDVESAYEQWQSLADKGYPEAYAQLSRYFLEGKSEHGVDIEKALYFYELSYKSGFTKDFNQLSRLLSIADTTNHFTKKLLTYLDKQVLLGNAEAILLQSQLKLEGIFYTEDRDTAIKAINTLAQQNHPEANFYLASIYRLGIYLKQDLEEAFRLNEKAYQLGHKKAAYQLASDFENGLGVTQDLEQAESILREKVEGNDPIASYRLAAFLQRHNESMPQEAITLYQRAQQSGYAQAKLRMADLYLHGDGVIKQPDKAIKMYSEMSLQGLGNASAKLGDLYRDGEYVSLVYTKANTLYQLALDQGFENAELRIAKMLTKGLGLKQDLDAAKAIYYKFATKGDANAAYQYAHILELQDSQAKLTDNTLKWYVTSANAGNEKAQLRIIEAVLNSAITDYSVTEALEMLEQLVEQKLPDAYLLLGDVYRTERWQLLDINESERLYLKALAAGEQQAIFKLVSLYTDPNNEIYNLENAQETLKQLDLSGPIDESFKLARLYENYLGKNTTPASLLSWYETSASTGYIPARLRLVDLMLQGSGIEQNIPKAVNELSALMSLGVGAATSRTAKLYEQGTYYERSFEKAQILYQQAIAQGYTGAYLPLARLIYRNAKSTDDINYAYGIFEKLSLQGKPEAQFYLATMYRDLKEKLALNWLDKAIYWYRISSYSGYQDAKYEYAVLLDERAGQATLASTELLKELALSGHGKAQLLYGKRLFNGTTVASNQLDGFKFVYLAVNKQTKNGLDELLEQIMQIEQLTWIDIAIAKSNEITEKNNNVPIERPLSGVQSYE